MQTLKKTSRIFFLFQKFMKPRGRLIFSSKRCFTDTKDKLYFDLSLRRTEVMKV